MKTLKKILAVILCVSMLSVNDLDYKFIAYAEETQENETEFTWLEAASDWYKDFTYTLDDTKNEIVITDYLVEDASSTTLVIPESATIADKTYSTVLFGVYFIDEKCPQNAKICDDVILRNDESNVPFKFSGNVERIDIGDCDCTDMTSTFEMFADCEHLKVLDVSKLNTTNVINMGEMFCLCKSLEDLDVSNFDTKKCYRNAEHVQALL